MTTFKDILFLVLGVVIGLFAEVASEAGLTSAAGTAARDKMQPRRE